MRTEHLPAEWRNTSRHPELPGQDLGCVKLEGGDTILYDRDNPEAYIQGESHSIGHGEQIASETPF